MAEVLVFNGVDAVLGRYLLPAMAPAEISTVARRGLPETDDLKELRWWHHRVSEKSFGPKEGIDARQLSQAGWGVIFAHDADPAVRKALGELLDHRRRQAGQYYREFTGGSGYQPGMSKQEFLARQGAGPGPADPDVVPYYLLIVGDPGSIPYSFQYQLDVQYAVGRLHFDRVEDYASYARSVVAAETGQVLRQPRLQLFATHNPGDSATQLSSSRLVTPLAASLRDARPDWKVQACIGEDATKHALSELLRDPSPPALLFTATHGIGSPRVTPASGTSRGRCCARLGGPDRGRRPAGRGPVLRRGRRRDGDGRRRAHRLPLRLLRGGNAAVGRVRRRRAGEPAAPGSRPVRRRAAPAPARARAGRGAGGRGSRRPGLGVFVPVAGGGQPDRGLRELPAAPAHRSPRRVGAGVLQPALRRAFVGAEQGAGRRAVRQATRPRDAGQAVDGEQRRPQLRDPRGPCRPPRRRTSVLRAPRTAPAEVPIIVSDLPALPRPRPVPGDETRLPAPPPEPAEAEFGLFDGARQVRDRLAATLQAVAQNLGAALERAVDDVMVVEVTTYTSNDLSAIDYDRRTGRFTGDTTLRAVTRMGLGGDTRLLMPEQHDVVDQCVWTLHATMVQEARQTRVEMIKAVGALVGVGGLKPT